MEFSGVSGMTASGVSMSDSVWLGGAGVAAGVAFLPAEGAKPGTVDVGPG